jgi:hypothetical protein
LIYVSTWDVPHIQKLAGSKATVPGKVSTGIVARVREKTNQGIFSASLLAINPLTGEKKWTIPKECCSAVRSQPGV